MGLSDGRKSFPIGLAVLIQYRSVTDTQPACQPATQPPSHVAVAITLNALAKASSLKTVGNTIIAAAATTIYNNNNIISIAPYSRNFGGE